MEKKNSLTQKRLKEVLHYDKLTGEFTWLKREGLEYLEGRVAGAYTSDYISIGIDNENYLAHRLAWLYMEGYFPEQDIDHINQIGTDNSWCNLRHVNRSCNMRNTGEQFNNTSGITGVCWHKVTKQWRVSIVNNYKATYGGIFKNFNDAVIKRWRLECEFGWETCCTTSSSYNYLKDNNLIPTTEQIKYGF